MVESAFNVGDPGSIPGLGRSRGEGNGNPLQYSCLKNSMHRGTWWATYSPWDCKEADMTEWLTILYLLVIYLLKNHCGRNIPQPMVTLNLAVSVSKRGQTPTESLSLSYLLDVDGPHITYSSVPKQWSEFQICFYTKGGPSSIILFLICECAQFVPLFLLNSFLS